MRRSHVDDKIAAMMAQLEATRPQAARRGHAASCAQKDRHPSAEAARAIALMNGMASKLEVYECEHCHAWHFTRRRKGS